MPTFIIKKKDADIRLRLLAHHKPLHTKREVRAVSGQLLNVCNNSLLISGVVIQRRLSYIQLRFNLKATQR